MNCTDFSHALDDFLDEGLDTSGRELVLSHSLSCRQCSQRLALASLLRLRLRHVAVPPAPEGYAQRVLAKARVSAQPRQRPLRQAASWFSAGALAASAALAALLFNQQQPQVALPAPVQTVQTAPAVAARSDLMRVVRIEPGQVQPVKLVFRSPGALSAVTLELSLPAGVELAGYPGRNRLSWKTDLRAGPNVLELPVQLQGSGGVLTATINLSGERRSFSVLVTTPAENNAANQHAT